MSENKIILFEAIKEILFIVLLEYINKLKLFFEVLLIVWPNENVGSGLRYILIVISAICDLRPELVSGQLWVCSQFSILCTILSKIV